MSPTLPLVAVGLFFGFVPFGPSAPSDPEFVLVALLAPLVFGEAMSSSIVDLRRVSRPVMLLAIGLVVFGAFMVGLAVTLVVPGIPWAVAFALGAVLAPTDAVAVSATASKAGLPRRTVQILEGESLVNDGTALTLLKVASTAAMVGSVTFIEISGILLQSVLGGLIVGALGGAIIVWVIRHSRDAVVTNAIIVLSPFPLYFGAEALGGSGILCVVLAALIVAHATSSAVTYNGRLLSASIWKTVTFILQSAAFLMVGLEIPPIVGDMKDTTRWQLVVIVIIVILTLLVSRFLFVFFMTLISKVSLRDPSWVVVAYAGSRGPISILAAFTIPLEQDNGDPIPFRSLAVAVTLLVVLGSLVSSPTLPWLVKHLKMTKDDDSEMIARARVQMARTSLDRLEEIASVSERAGRPIQPEVLDRLRTAAEGRLNVVSRRLEGDGEKDEPHSAHHAQFIGQISTQMMRSEQEELLRLRSEEGLPDDVMRELQRELDIRIRAAAVHGEH